MSQNNANGNWENIYINQGRVQSQILDSVIEAKEIFSKNNCKKILDLGCGTGRNSLYLSANEFEVYACDISETGVDITQKLLEKHGYNNVNYSIQNMFSMDYEDNFFDGILCIWVQGHGLKNQIQTGVNEIYRTLKKDGIVITDFVTTNDPTYGIGEEIEKNTFVGGRPGEENIPHFYAEKSDIEEMFSNFQEVKIKSKIYEFEDQTGNSHKIDAFLVFARK